MATHDIDQKILGTLAKQVGSSHPVVSAALFQVLGLSILLSRRVYRARALRYRHDVKSLAVYHRIIWLAREGLALTDSYISPFAEQFTQKDPLLKIVAEKLRGSFYHIFCMFNSTSYSISLAAPPRNPSTETAVPQTGHVTRRNTPLRDTIPSMLSETSYVTNPYSSSGAGALSPPPGLLFADAPDPAALPNEDLVAIAHHSFERATWLAMQLLPGSAPLRLLLALEYATFLWECVHDKRESRAVAREAIADVYRAPEAMNDAEFEDATTLVEALGQAMRRKSDEELVERGEKGPGEEEVIGDMPLQMIAVAAQ